MWTKWGVGGGHVTHVADTGVIRNEGKNPLEDLGIHVEHVRPLLPVWPDVLSLARELLSGYEWTSSNRIYFSVFFFSY